MNTVLDDHDNKMLCLANSERIKLNSTIHMVFEVQDLAVASPATVSRYSINFFGFYTIFCILYNFETQNLLFLLLLSNFCLCTFSYRCGMVYVDPGELRCMYKHGLSISFPLNYLTPPRYTCVTCSLTNTHVHTLTLTSQ